MELTNKELNNIVGGAMTGTFISSLIRGASLIFEIGKSFGSALRRMIKGNYC